MVEFLALVILVSIALGISLQNALWGIIAFIVGSVLVLILTSVLGLGGTFLFYKVKRSQTPQAKAARKQKFVNDLPGKLLGLLFAWPLIAILAFYFAIGTEEIENHIGIVLAIAFIPFVIGLIMFLVHVAGVVNKARK